MLNCEFGSLVDLEEKALVESDEVVTITGYASTFGNEDLGGDIVVKGAFTESLQKRGMPLLLFQHKMEDAPLGPVIEAKEDARGLWFKAELPKDDSFNKGRVIPQLKRKGLKGVSIGFRVKAGGAQRRNGVRYIEKADLFEISLVNMPMNPQAAVETVKAERFGVDDWKALTDREREAHFKTLGFSDELAKRFVRLDREGRDIKGQREAGAGLRGIPDFAATIRQFAK